MSQASSTHTLPSVTPYQGPGISIETKLMHQYRLASPVENGTEGVAVRNAQGEVELFTVGTDGTVWNFSPDRKSETGFRALNTGLTARKASLGTRVAAGLDHDGSIVAFVRGPQASQVGYATKRQGVWSPSAQVKFPTEFTGEHDGNLSVIFDVRTRTAGGQLFVAVVGRLIDGGPTYMAVTNWSSTPGTFKTFTRANSPTPPISAWPGEVPLGTSFWTHTTTSATPAFSVYIPRVLGTRFQGFVTLDVDCNFKEYVSSPGGMLNYVSATVDIESPPDAVGRNKMFVITAAGELRQLTDGKVIDGTPRYISYESETLARPPAAMRKVYAVHDHKGATHLFCISKDNGLYHLPPDAASPTGYPPIGLPIKKGVQWIAVARNAAGNIELFYMKAGAGAPLVHLTLDQLSGDWEEQTVEVQSAIESANQLEEFISYSTDMTFIDAVGAPLANAAVTIRASDRTGITVNNATFPVDATTTAALTTDAVGKLTITHQTSGLSVPDLWIHVAPLIPDDQVLVLQQYANGRDDKNLPDNMKSIQARMANLKRKELAEAKDAKGNYLLNETYRSNDKFTGDLATACNQCMKLGGTAPPAAPLHPLISRKGSWTGVHIESEEAAMARSRVVAHDGLPSWSLTLGKDGIDYQDLTHEQARTSLAALRASAGAYTKADGKPWWATIGDFFESILDGVVTIGKVVVHGVTAAFHFVIDSVSYVFEAVVKFVQDSFEMLESILASAYKDVENFFERTFEWIGFLLNWDDILRTQTVVSHVVDQMLDFMKLAGPAMQKKVDAGFAAAQAKIASTFDELIAQTGSNSFGSYTKEHDRHDPVTAHAHGNNVVGNAFLSNWKGAKVPAHVKSSHLAGANDLGPLLDRFADDKSTKPEWKNTVAFFAKTTSPDQFFAEALTGFYRLLKDLALAVVSGTQVLVDKLLEQMAGMIDALRETLTREVPIPLVSELFQLKVGKPLNTVNLMALMAAIPTTVLYKAITGVAPFPDDASVQLLKAEFTAQWMFSASGFGAEHENSLALGEMSPQSRRKLQISCGSMTIVYGVIAAPLNLASAKDIMDGSTKASGPFQFFSGLLFALELANQGCGFPLCLEAAPTPGVYALWGYQLFGVGLDAYYLVAEGLLPQNVLDSVFPVMLSGMFGLFDLLFTVIKGVNTWGDAPGVLVSLAECINWMLWKQILRSGTPGRYVAVVQPIMTGVLYITAGGIQCGTAKAALLADMARAESTAASVS